MNGERYGSTHMLRTPDSAQNPKNIELGAEAGDYYDTCYRLHRSRSHYILLTLGLFPVLFMLLPLPINPAGLHFYLFLPLFTLFHFLFCFFALRAAKSGPVSKSIPSALSSYQVLSELALKSPGLSDHNLTIKLPRQCYSRHIIFGNQSA